MKKIIHIIISVLYIIWGVGAPLTFIKNLANLDFSSILSLATIMGVLTGLVMFFAGIFGLLRIKPLKRRILGVVIFILAASSVITSLVGGQIAWQGILQAIMAWLYIIW
ncbi:MAG: hypothetical protein IJD38_10660 [Clostridia bacterium]|nr:hypothetical protein [Clostridia bacterium]